MLFVLSFLMLFQDHDHDSMVKFQPVSSGNVVEIGSYSLTIPEGVLYAGEDNVHYMFKLAGADFIPNAVGMYASASGTWDYSVTVQHFPSQNIHFYPLPPEIYQLYFNQIDMLTLRPVEGLANVLLSPQLNFDDQSVMLAMQYIWPDGQVVNCMKKLWVTPTEALIFTLNSNEAGFDGDFSQIEDIFSMVKVNPEALKKEVGPEPVPSFTYLGIEPQFQVDPSQVDTGVVNEEVKPVSFVPSLILVGFAAVLLFIALKLRNRKAEAASTS